MSKNEVGKKEEFREVKKQNRGITHCNLKIKTNSKKKD